MKKILLVSLLISIVALPWIVFADAILVTGSDLIGSRSTPYSSGIVAADGWTDTYGGFKISWNISLTGGVWNYSYSISNADGSTPTSPELSHWILEVSPIINEDNVTSYLWDFSVSPVEGPDTWVKGGSNPDMPESGIYGIKFDLEAYAFSFKSTQAPIWGDFYAKDGKPGEFGGVWATAWNTGFGTDPTSSTPSFINWIPTPDTIQVPEPTTLLLLGGGLVVLGVLRRKFGR